MERKGGPELSLSYIELPMTRIMHQYILHRETPNSNGQIFAGFFVNKSIQVAMLCMIELCELSQEGVIDPETGEEIPKMRAMESTKFIHLDSVDICNFMISHYTGHILEMQAEITYTDPKKGLAYVQVSSRDKDIVNSSTATSDQSQLNDSCFARDEKRNVLNLIYRVDRSIKLKQILPTDYSQSLRYLEGKRIIDVL